MEQEEEESETSSEEEGLEPNLLQHIHDNIISNNKSQATNAVQEKTIPEKATPEKATPEKATPENATPNTEHIDEQMNDTVKLNSQTGIDLNEHSTPRQTANDLERRKQSVD